MTLIGGPPDREAESTHKKHFPLERWVEGASPSNVILSDWPQMQKCGLTYKLAKLKGCGSPCEGHMAD
jgi:hypothetical protein